MSDPNRETKFTLPFQKPYILLDTSVTYLPPRIVILQIPCPKHLKDKPPRNLSHTHTRAQVHFLSPQLPDKTAEKVAASSEHKVKIKTEGFTGNPWPSFSKPRGETAGEHAWQDRAGKWSPHVGREKRNPTHQAIYLHLLHGGISGSSFAFAFACSAGGRAGRGGGWTGAFLAGRHLSSRTGKEKRELPEAEVKFYLTSGAVWRSMGGAVRKGRRGMPRSLLFSSLSSAVERLAHVRSFKRL